MEPARERSGATVGARRERGSLEVNAWTATALAGLTAAEREVADLLPIEADPADAEAVLEEVPFWFHTFALNRGAGLYAPGYARDHRYRIPRFPAASPASGCSISARSTASTPSLPRPAGRSGSSPSTTSSTSTGCGPAGASSSAGGEGFRAIHGLLGSGVEYRRLDAFELDRLDERFDFVFCCGILHRVEAPRRLLEVLRRRMAPGGRVLLETHGVFDGSQRRRPDPPLRARARSTRDDEYVYWGFAAAGLDLLARQAG